MNLGVIKQVAALPRMEGTDLRKMWREYFDGDPPSNNKTFLVKRLAYRIQELAYGGLSSAIEERMEAIDQDKETSPSAVMKNGKKPIDQPIPGTRLLREWKGVEHMVTVLEQGFEYQGRRFKSLSAVARKITGTRWNGPAFFGLRRQIKGHD